MSQAPDRVDPVDAVRRNPTWYFPTGQFEIPRFLSLITAEIWADGSVTNVDVRNVDDWWLIVADRDWLDGEVAAFFRLLPLPGGGVNSSRVEVLLFAFCPALSTGVGGDVFVIRTLEGVTAPRHLVADLEDGAAGRAILFKAPPAGDPTSAGVAWPRRSERIARHLDGLPGRLEDYLSV